MKLEHTWIELTNKCNLECSHCANNSGPSLPLYEGMKEDDWKNTIKTAYSLGTKSIQFIGGEPTIHPELIPLINYAHDLGIKSIEVFTNGTRISDGFLETVKRTNTQIAISVYGHTEELHNHVTLNKHAFKATLKGIKKLIENKVELRLGCVLSANNKEFKNDIQRFYTELGVEHIGYDNERKIGRLGTSSAKEEIKQLCGHCGSNRVAITASGKVYPCIFSRLSPIGNVLDSKLEDILISDPLNKFKSDLIDAISPTLNSYCQPFICAPDHQCVPDIKGPTCAPDYCGPGHQKTNEIPLFNH
jgi:radical SAM protein with 4Fe4S-binding SPASM domain